MLTMYFVLFCYYIPLEMGIALHLNITKSLLPKAALCQVCLKMTDENVKSLQTDERQTDDRSTGNQKSSHDISAQVS